MIKPVHPSLESQKAAAAERAKPDPALHRAVSEMESVFVRHLLEAAKLGGKSGESGYGAMATDALAAGIQAGGGLGLARAIEDSLRSSRSSSPASPRATAAPLAPAGISRPASPLAPGDPMAPAGLSSSTRRPTILGSTKPAGIAPAVILPATADPLALAVIPPSVIPPATADRAKPAR